MLPKIAELAARLPQTFPKTQITWLAAEDDSGVKYRCNLDFAAVTVDHVLDTIMNHCGVYPLKLCLTINNNVLYYTDGLDPGLLAVEPPKGSEIDLDARR